MIAGRNGSSFSSSKTAPCICSERPTQAISVAAMLLFFSTAATASQHACHQSFASCSAQPIRGEANGTWSAGAEATIAPLSLTNTARVPPVPTSMPRTCTVFLAYEFVEELSGNYAFCYEVGMIRIETAAREALEKFGNSAVRQFVNVGL